MTTDLQADEGRAARKRRVILDAATGLFLERGYAGTSMDEVAAAASASKQTLYKHFHDKERLFEAVVLRTAERSDRFVATVVPALQDADDAAAALEALARTYVATVMDPRVVQLRRLLIAEAARFPDLARTYYEQVPRRVLQALADGLEGLNDRGALRLAHAPTAATHLAFLIVGLPLDQAMFCVEAGPEQAEALAMAGVRAFLQAYGPG